ncbi:MAG: cupin domain-containing protein [Candidatus Dormibacter sp.]|uniref:cupin domain-containing protein n=1 Tax=Candidatus Dormibacter sp. TaxID=2973982 RepID=UPI000DB5665C|nr:MAG: cupin domain-containing protein [Candidatus Dormibacteraeota bacterium]
MTEATLISFAELGREGSFTFGGADHGDVPTSFILDRSKPGAGPALHRPPYDEVWILEEGEATFTAGDRTLTAGPGSILIVGAGTPHKFINTGTTPLRMVCIHPRARMETEWLEPGRRPEPGEASG